MSDETATAGEATTATSAGDQNTVVADWRTEISEPGLRRVAEKFTSPAEVVKSYAALQSRLGRSVVKPGPRSEEHTSELQSLMRISYAVFCLKKKHKLTNTITYNTQHIPSSST